MSDSGDLCRRQLSAPDSQLRKVLVGGIAATTSGSEEKLVSPAQRQGEIMLCHDNSVEPLLDNDASCGMGKSVVVPLVRHCKRGIGAGSDNGGIVNIAGIVPKSKNKKIGL